jgi:uncharacterized tellurite resistance protein B-like protein
MNIFSFFSSKPSEAAQSHIKNLVALANADGKFSDEELALIKSVAKKNHVSLTCVNEIVKNLDTVEFEVPSDRTIKFNQLYDLIKMVLADKVADEVEMRYCRNIALKFGYKKQYVQDLVDSIRCNIVLGKDCDDAMLRVGWMLS